MGALYVQNTTPNSWTKPTVYVNNNKAENLEYNTNIAQQTSRQKMKRSQII